MHEAALEILSFLDGLEDNRRRRDMVLSSAVASGVVTAVQAWPEFFDEPDQGTPDAFPSTDADMSAFQMEDATTDSFARDMALLEALEANKQISIREEDPPQFPRIPGVPDHLEWT